MATVYLDSSDDEATPSATTAKGKSASYAPPRLTAAAKPSPGRFQFPTSKLPTRASVPSGIRNASVSSNSGRPTPSPEDPSNAQGIPGSQPASILNSKGNTGEPTGPASSGSGKLESDRPPRSSLALERQMNELAGTIEEFRTTNNEDLREIRSILAAIRATVDRLEAIAASASAASTSAASSSDTPPPLLPPVYAFPPSSDVKPVMSNPPLTPELSATISKVVQEARSRIGKKKLNNNNNNNNPEENSIKDHARKVFYRMLGISAAASVRGYFLNAHGQPDTLPAQFVDPDTLYCRPYPHWGVAMTQQMAWVPTYLSLFRAMIPKDRSELSKLLTNLPDEQVVILLHDGPFKTACTTFKSSQKTEAELAQLRSKARRYQRVERRYIKDMPALQSPDWAFLEHSGYMSADESDGEGVLVTKVPSSRSQWVTNTYRAIGVAEYLRTKGKYVPPSKTQIINAPIPHLERGTGSAKMTLRIAECAISKSWRASHPDEFVKSAHLVNSSETTKPNVLGFLERHPLSLLNRDNEDIAVKEERDAGTGTEERPPIGWKETPPIEYDGDEESAMILEVLELGGPAAAGMETGRPMSDIPIDPQLLGAPAYGSGPSAGPSSHPESSPPPVGDILAGLDSEPNLSPSPPTSGMPPPPLPPMITGNPGQPLPTPENLVENLNQTVEEVSSGGIPKKRRGRPPGSKNKKKQKTMETIGTE